MASLYSRSLQLRAALPLPLTLGVALLAGCSSGGGDTAGTVASLTGPGQVAVVTPDETTGGGAPATGSGDGGVAQGAGGYPADSDYNTDNARTYIYDPSMESLSTVNSILCQTSKTAYPQMVNRGAYNAQIDVALCETGGNPDSSASGQSAGGAGNLEIFTVLCARASNNVPQLVQFWVPGDMDNVATTILAEMSLTRGASLTDPFGAFQLSFANVADIGGDVQNPDMYGVLETRPTGNGELGFDFFNSMGDINVVHNPGEFSNIEQVAVQMDSAMEVGVAHVRTQMRYNFGSGDSGIQVSEWKLAFDADNIKRQEDSDAPVVLSRVNYDTMVWRYNLYHASGGQIGERVDLNSGFGFRTAGEEYGWIGYHGMWVPEGVTINTGDTITKDTFGTDTVETFTVLQAPGKLVRNSRNTMNLTDLAGQAFRWWDANAGVDYLLEYNTSTWWKTASWNMGTNEWDTLGGGPVALDVTADAGGWLDMWSDGLGGRVNYVDGELFITFYSQTLVTASDALFANGNTPSLFGFMNCLDFELTAAEVEAGSIYLPNVTDVNAPLEYIFDKTDLTLYYNNPGDTLRQVGLATGQIPTSGDNMWGMTSGPMIENAGALSGVEDIWSVTEFYTYETGHNSWNKYTALTDSESSPVTFDAPLQFTYTHSTAADRNDDATYDGQLYFLEYNGPGDLYGIPFDGTDIDGDGNPDRWYPRFSFKDGTLMGPTGAEYVIRASEMEQTLQADPGGGGTLDLADAANLTLPDGSSYSTPTNGTKPVVTGPPAVIDGVVQGAE